MPKPFLPQGLCTSYFSSSVITSLLSKTGHRQGFSSRATPKWSLKPLILYVWHQFIFLLILAQLETGRVWHFHITVRRWKPRVRMRQNQSHSFLGGAKLSKDRPRDGKLASQRRKCNLNAIHSLGPALLNNIYSIRPLQPTYTPPHFWLLTLLGSRLNLRRGRQSWISLSFVSSYFSLSQIILFWGQRGWFLIYGFLSSITTRT